MLSWNIRKMKGRHPAGPEDYPGPRVSDFHLHTDAVPDGDSVGVVQDRGGISGRRKPAGEAGTRGPSWKDSETPAQRLRTSQAEGARAPQEAVSAPGGLSLPLQASGLPQPRSQRRPIAPKEGLSSDLVQAGTRANGSHSTMNLATCKVLYH